MNVKIIGAGNIGANTARLFAHAGQKVTASNSRRPKSLVLLVKETGTNARAATVEGVASFGDLTSSKSPARHVPDARREDIHRDVLRGAADGGPPAWWGLPRAFRRG